MYESGSSVDHGMTSPGAGFFTLHTDATHIMEEHSRPPVGTRGSYEVYHDQRVSTGEIRNASPNVGQAPGCPGSLPESAQKVEELSRQLTDVSHQLSVAKQRENKMMQTIGELQSQSQEHRQAFVLPPGNQGQQLTHDAHKSPAREQLMHQTVELPPPPRPHNSVSHGYVNLGGSQPPESVVEESVKDGHIKHLQRQVTVLQANLYKAEEYRNRAQEAMKERDNAIDELRSAAHHLSNVKQENELLKQESEAQRVSLLQAQQQLTRLHQELEGERLKSQGQSSAQESLMSLREENQSLKVTMNKLSQDNIRLREMNSEHSNMSNMSGGRSSGSDHSSTSACSAELEYLHHVVDALKSTVLEQRRFLQNIKDNPPQINGLAVNGRRDVTSSAGMSQSSPNSTAGSDRHQQVGQGDSHFSVSQQPGLKLPPAVPQRQPVTAGTTGSQENGYSDLLQANSHNQSVQFSKEIMATSISLATSNTSVTAMSSSASSLSSNSKKSVSRVSSSVTPSSQPPHPAISRKLSHSETFVRRPSPVDNIGLNLSQGGSKSAVLATAPQQQRPSVVKDLTVPTDWTVNNTAGTRFPPTVALANVDRNVMKPRPSPASCSLAQSPALPQRRSGLAYEAALLPPEIPLSRPDMNNSNLPATPRTLTSSRTTPVESQQQPIYRPPILNSDNSLRVINSDNMGGSRMTTGAAAAQSNGSERLAQGQTDLGAGGYLDQRYVIPQSVGQAAPPGPHTALNSDRVCPVCNRDYSQVSMEDFQSHVFECFDDDTGPETMKAEDIAERACPMCNKKFRGDLPQHEFEAHVHSHFGEESFEMLHRD